MSDWLKQDNFDFESKQALEKLTVFPKTKGDSGKCWNAIEKTIDSNDPLFSLKTYLRMAAVVSLLVVGAVLILNSRKSEIIQLQSLQNQQEYKLPDGSYLLLDRNSKVSYESNFEKNRTLTLENGKLFLDVTHDGSPFKVITDNFNIQVLGTSFSVDKTNNLVHVYDGLVSVIKDQTELKVEAGESVALKNNILLQSEININDIAWKTGELSFENTILSEVIDELNGHFNSKIRFSKALGNCRVSAVFKDQSLKETVQILSTILNAKANFNDRNISLTGKSCN